MDVYFSDVLKKKYQVQCFDTFLVDNNKKEKVV
jgi:hypothetical protein